MIPLLALATTVAAANGIGFSHAKGQTVPKHNTHNNNNLLPRAIPTGIIACDVGESRCHDSCMPDASVCCKAQDGAFCDAGYTCYDQGCCPKGQKCDGPPSGCDGDFKLCKNYCIPMDGVCCDSEALLGPAYCAKGETCLAAGRCAAADGDDNGPVSSQGARSMTKVLSDVYSLQTMDTSSGSRDGPAGTMTKILSDVYPVDTSATNGGGGAQPTGTSPSTSVAATETNADASNMPTATDAGTNTADGVHAPAVVACALAFAALLL